MNDIRPAADASPQDGRRPQEGPAPAAAHDGMDAVGTRAATSDPAASAAPSEAGVAGVHDVAGSHVVAGDHGVDGRSADGHAAARSHPDAPGTRPRPPRRPWRPVVTVVAFVVAVVLGVVAHTGSVTWMVPALALPMVLLAIGWVPLLRLPSPRGTTIVQLIAVVLLLVPAAISPTTTLERLPGFVALSMIASFVHQLVRRDARPRLVESVSAVAAGVALLSSAACLVPLVVQPQGRDAIAAVMGATAAATLADIGLGRRPRGGVAAACAVASVVLGGFGAWGVHAAFGSSSLPFVAVAGALAGGFSYALRQIQSVLPSLWGRRAQIASAAGSVLSTGVIAYGLAWFTGAVPL